ncbi:MAG: hypothetical protein FJX35_03990 [Alphaproteobacteria bacterium]|nr:hypothetical protein [Alphaproteobacteria bacterium]
MSTQTFTFLYDTYDDAAHTVGELEACGVPPHAISMIANTAGAGGTALEDSGAGASGAGTGAKIGGVVGGGAGLLAGLGVVTIPGLGPVVGAGWLISTLVVAAAGAAAGGFVGALTGAGVSKDDAHVYAEGVRRGGTLVTVRVPESQAIMVDEIMRRHAPVDTATRASDYRGGGWREFDVEARPFTEEEIERERARYKSNFAA